MEQYTSREFTKIVQENGFKYDRSKWRHIMYINEKGRHISIPKRLECLIARRLMKENNFILNK